MYSIENLGTLVIKNAYNTMRKDIKGWHLYIPYLANLTH